jgi:cytochrome P450
MGVLNSTKRKIDFNKSVVIDTLVDPTSAKDHSVLDASQLAEEVIMLLSAGNDTTSDAIIVGIYQSIRNLSVHRQLTEELTAAFPSHVHITYDRAKKLPYLVRTTDLTRICRTALMCFQTAVIKETLRYSNPLPGKAPRVVPQGGWMLYGHKVPPKVWPTIYSPNKIRAHFPFQTVINTSSYLLNRHPSVWGPDAYEFRPERWLDDDAAHLEKYMSSFYRGTRQCLGKE